MKREILKIGPTRKYPLRGYILGSGAPGTRGVIPMAYGTTLLVTSCDSPAGIGASLRTHVRTDGLTNGWTDRRDVGNSILDYINLFSMHFQK